MERKMRGITTKVTDLVSTPYSSRDIAAWETRTRDLLDEYCGEGSDPECCNSALTSRAHFLHSELSIRIGYHHALKNALRFAPANNRHWGWHALIDTPLLRLGLISLQRVFSLPLHDHPNAHGVLKVISGRVRVQQYRYDSNSGRDNTLVSLEQVSDHNLARGESSAFTPSFQNLHELESLSSRSILLSMMVNPYRPHERSWYYQVPFTQSGNKGLYNRIRRRQT